MTPNKRFFFALQVNNNDNISTTGKENPNKRMAGLFTSLPLLIIITTALNTSNSVATIQLASPANLASFRASNLFSKNDSTMMPSKISSATDHPVNSVELRDSFELRLQQHNLAYHNNDNVISHVVIPRQGNQQLVLEQQQQHYQRPYQIPHVIPESPRLDSMASQNINGDRETILTTSRVTDSENFNQRQQQQLRPTINNSVEEPAATDESGDQAVQQVSDGGPVVEMSELSKDSPDGQLKKQLLERRFGLFKKDRNNNNNNLPYSNYAMAPYFNECDRCLASSNLNSQGATWLLEPQAYGHNPQYNNNPYNFYYHQQQQQPSFQTSFMSSHNTSPLMLHLIPFKNKLSKFQMSKSVPMKDYYLSKNYQYHSYKGSNSSNKYRMPISSSRAVPYRPQQNQLLNCMQPTLLGSHGGGNLIVDPNGEAFPHQGSFEDLKDSQLPQQLNHHYQHQQQMSY